MGREDGLMHTMDNTELSKFSVPTFIAEQPSDDIQPEFLHEIENRYGFLNRLLTAPAVNSIFTTENGERKYRQIVQDCDTGDYEVITGKTIWTELPEDIGTACCHTKPDVNGCLTKATVKRLCLKDCFDDITEHFRRRAQQGFSLFGGRGAEAEYEAEMRAWFVFFQARDIMYGQMGVTGNNVAEFPGVLDIMNDAVVSFSGADIIGVFEQISCRLSILGGNYVMGAHPMVVKSLRNAVTRGGQMYTGWSVVNGILTFENIPIVEDILVPINLEAGTGQIWAADLNKVGVYMEYALSNPLVQWTNSYTDSATGDCFEKCLFLKNYGFAFTKDYNALFRIVDVPLDGACLGENTLLGLGSLIIPDTLVPTYS